jgi:dienelactone hydrolase
MITFIKFLLVVCCNFFSTVYAQSLLEGFTALQYTEKPPNIYKKQLLVDGFESLYFDGARYRNKPTRIFAYYKAPQGTGPFPAMVLVHGGGGSAFKAWIQKWNDAGFAAISIAVEGQTGRLTGNKKPKWQKHEDGGPSRDAIYNDSDQPITDQWMYHATFATISAHNLLRSFDEINSEQIGLSGISWGGVITSTVIGFDQRFAFAIPIYGSGFLDSMANQYGKALKNNETYKNIWEPALRINRFANPTFWLTGLKEAHFSLDGQANTYKLLTVEHVQSIQPDLKHGHNAGWKPQEPYLFAQKVIKNNPLVSFYQQEKLKHTVSTKVTGVNDISSASLYYTNDKGHTSQRKWQKLTVAIDKEEANMLLTSFLPLTAKSWFFNIESNGLIYSSEFSERE